MVGYETGSEMGAVVGGVMGGVPGELRMDEGALGRLRSVVGDDDFNDA